MVGKDLPASKRSVKMHILKLQSRLSLHSVGNSTCFIYSPWLQHFGQASAKLNFGWANPARQWARNQSEQDIHCVAVVPVQPVLQAFCTHSVNKCFGYHRDLVQIQICSVIVSKNWGQKVLKANLCKHQRTAPPVPSGSECLFLCQLLPVQKD